MSKKTVVQPQDKFVLRMPDGLRSRIKAYAERQGTSMNHEIVRILEREFPEQWPVDTRLSQLAKMMSILKAGVSDPRIDDFISQFEETVEGIVTGRVTDVDLETREAIVDMWKEYRFKEDEEAFEANQDAMLSELDEEEQEMFELIGKTEKFAVRAPRRKQFHEMTEEEQVQHLRKNMDDPREAPPANGDDPFRSED